MVFHKVKRPTARAALERVLTALGEELLAAKDEELLEAARELGMDPRMKGSAAFAGIRYPATWRAEDFFQVPFFRPEALRSERSSPRLEADSKPDRRKRRSRRSGPRDES